MGSSTVQWEVHLFDMGYSTLSGATDNNNNLYDRMLLESNKERQLYITLYQQFSYSIREAATVSDRYEEQYWSIWGASERYGVHLAFSTLSCATDNNKNLCDRILLVSNKERQLYITLSQQFSNSVREAATEWFPVSDRYEEQPL